MVQHCAMNIATAKTEFAQGLLSEKDRVNNYLEKNYIQIMIQHQPEKNTKKHKKGVRVLTKEEEQKSIIY